MCMFGIMYPLIRSVQSLFQQLGKNVIICGLFVIPSTPDLVCIPLCGFSMNLYRMRTVLWTIECNSPKIDANK